MLGCLGIIFIIIFFRLFKILVIGVKVRFVGFVIVFVWGILLVCNWLREVSVFSVMLEVGVLLVEVNILYCFLLIIICVVGKGFIGICEIKIVFLLFFCVTGDVEILGVWGILVVFIVIKFDIVKLGVVEFCWFVVNVVFKEVFKIVFFVFLGIRGSLEIKSVFLICFCVVGVWILEILGILVVFFVIKFGIFILGVVEICWFVVNVDVKEVFKLILFVFFEVLFVLVMVICIIFLFFRFFMNGLLFLMIRILEELLGFCWVFNRERL